MELSNCERYVRLMWGQTVDRANCLALSAWFCCSTTTLCCWRISSTPCATGWPLYTRVQRDAPMDYFFVWEDMCFKNGPFISPDLLSRDPGLMPR